MSDKKQATQHYTKLPNRIFYVKKEDKKKNSSMKSILKMASYDKKIILIMDYLQDNSNMKFISRFTLKDMIQSSGYKLKSGKNGINNIFKNSLIFLQDNRGIKCDKDLKEITINELIKCEINFFNQKDEKDSEYFKSYDEHKKRIFDYSFKNNIDHAELYSYYCYLSCRMHKRANDKGDVSNGGKAEVCYPSYELINGDLGITDNTIKKYNDILVGLDIFRIGSAGRQQIQIGGNSITHDCPNFYTFYNDNEYLAQLNLSEGIKLYKLNNKEYKFIDKADDCENRRNWGYISRINQLENQCKATNEQVNKRDALIESMSLNKQQLKIVKLLEGNHNELLSDICYKLAYEQDNDKEYGYYENLYTEYNELEIDLGLTDEDSNLEVDYDYYKWIMTNYRKSEHEKYKDFIDNKIKESKLKC